MYQLTVQVERLILLVILLSLWCVVINATNSQECGEKNLIGLHGILTSPNYPNQYPEKTNCSWFLKTTNNTTATIIITNLDIEADERDCQEPTQKDCCKNNALIISNEKFCGKEKYPTRITSTGEITIEISFTTSKNPQRRKGFRLIFSIRSKTLCEGYDLSCLDERACYNRNDICDSHYKCADHSDEINCAKCGDNQASCNNYSNYCFDPSTQRCDGIFHCPGGEDELDCLEICPKRLQCKNGSGCYNETQICDQNPDCTDNSDESDCTLKLCGRQKFLCKNKKCIDIKLTNNNVNDCGDNSDEEIKTKINYSALVILSVTTLSMGFLMIIYRWFTTRRNIRRFMEDLPIFSLPLFRGPGEPDHIICTSFSQADFLHGGQIYEAFVRTRKRLPAPDRKTRKTSSTPNQLGQRFRNCNPSCAAAALASLGIASESCIGAKRVRSGCEECDYCQSIIFAKGYSTSTESSDEKKRSGDKLDKTKEMLELYFIHNYVCLVSSEDSFTTLE